MNPIPVMNKEAGIIGTHLVSGKNDRTICGVSKNGIANDQKV